MSAPVSFPFGIGVVPTEMVQDAPAFSSAPQLLVCENFPADVPVMAILLIVKVADPSFVSVVV
ncbi:MAG TPA: hypothetical protein VMT20_23650 [Terriglobia bacterium]|nr:hypothetical protein [Terriglobia bacterium]